MSAATPSALVAMRRQNTPWLSFSCSCSVRLWRTVLGIVIDFFSGPSCVWVGGPQLGVGMFVKWSMLEITPTQNSGHRTLPHLLVRIAYEYEQEHEQEQEWECEMPREPGNSSTGIRI
jgi:hypothetical protein